MQQSQKNRKNANKFASATEALRNLTIEDIKRYLVWYMTEFKIKKLSALYGTTRTWRLMYAQKTRHRLAVEVREQMTDVGFIASITGAGF